MEKFALRARHPSKFDGIERFFVKFNGVRRASADQVWRHGMHSIWNRFYLCFAHVNFSFFLGLSTFLSPCGAKLLLFRGYLRAQAFLLLPQLRRELGAKILRLEQLANLDLAILVMRIGAALDPFNRLFLRLHLP